MTSTHLQILLHAPDAEGLQRARMNAVNAQKADPRCEVRIIANASAVAAALDTPHPQADSCTLLCPNTLAHLQRPCKCWTALRCWHWHSCSSKAGSTSAPEPRTPAVRHATPTIQAGRRRRGAWSHKPYGRTTTAQQRHLRIVFRAIPAG